MIRASANHSEPILVHGLPVGAGGGPWIRYSDRVKIGLLGEQSMWSGEERAEEYGG